MKKLTIFAAAFAAMFGFAQASVYSYNHDINALPGTSDAGQITNFSASFNDLGDASTTDGFLSFNFELDYSADPANKPNVGWIALNNGGNPSTNVDDVARMIIDFDTGDLYFYSYRNSGTPNQAYHIATMPGEALIQDNGSSISVSMGNLDVSAINSWSNAASWSGIQFDENIGAWILFHSMDDFAADGTHVTYYDFGAPRSMIELTTGPAHVSEPFGLALIGLMGLGVVALRRRK